MTAFDLLIRGGTVVDGTGAPGRPADVGVLGDRILAVGDLTGVDGNSAMTVIDAIRRVVTPGFIDPHGHSDGSLFLDGALTSHLRQGFTTQLSGNCGESLAPITDAGREVVELSLRPNELVARWRTFSEYLDAVGEERLGPNVAFLVGHGTVRAAVMGAEGRQATDLERHAMVREVDAAMDSGAVGLSSGLIYAPGMHADAEELRAVATAAARRGGLYASHMRNEADGLFEALDEAVSTIRAAADAGVDRPRLQVSHLKCASRAAHGRAAEAVGVLEAARSDGLAVGADQYPYTAAATTLTTVLPPALLGLGMEACVAALSDPDVRGRVKSEIDRGISGWENIGRDPGWKGIRISYSASHPDWSGRSLADLADEFSADPADLAFDALVDDRLDVSIVIDCMTPADVETILGVPWIAVCTDASSRRPGHPVLDVGRPHPRTYGTTGRVLGTYVRERGTLPLETAVEKLTSVPAAQIGLRDRGVLREGAYADLVVFDPTAIADVATYEDPARHPVGIEHVVVNGRLVITDGAETDERPGRLLRRGS
ncbi:MAG TPA: D-aminoacylase [Candidatus Limnocylindrales bacterium]|nr:D-aminoacylase [Candidatus Limnocylindrales bacterium]